MDYNDKNLLEHTLKLIQDKDEHAHLPNTSGPEEEKLIYRTADIVLEALNL